MKKLYVISAIALLVLTACEKVDWAGSREGESVLDSLVTVLAPPPGVHSLDVFVYEASGLKRLQAARRVVAGVGGAGSGKDGCLCDSVFLKLPVGDKIIAAVGDSPYGFKASALGTYDALSHLTVLYYDEDIERPLQSGQVSCKAGDTVKVTLSGLLVPITLEEVSHEFAGYDCLEDPKIILKDAAASVEIFREVGFRPSDTVSDTLGMRSMMWEKLPCDIGFYPQNPGVTLYCYPNDDGPVQTSFVLEGKYKKQIVSFPYKLPALKKGYSYRLKLEIGETPSVFSYELNYGKL